MFTINNTIPGIIPPQYNLPAVAAYQPLLPQIFFSVANQVPIIRMIANTSPILQARTNLLKDDAKHTTALYNNMVTRTTTDRKINTEFFHPPDVDSKNLRRLEKYKFLIPIALKGISLFAIYILHKSVISETINKIFSTFQPFDIPYNVYTFDVRRAQEYAKSDIVKTMLLKHQLLGIEEKFTQTIRYTNDLNDNTKNLCKFIFENYPDCREVETLQQSITPGRHQLLDGLESAALFFLKSQTAFRSLLTFSFLTIYKRTGAISNLIVRNLLPYVANFDREIFDQLDIRHHNVDLVRPNATINYRLRQIIQRTRHQWAPKDVKNYIIGYKLYHGINKKDSVP